MSSAADPARKARYARAKDIFLAALETAPRDRLAYLAEACGADAELRAEVESLLGHHTDAPLLAQDGPTTREGEPRGASPGEDALPPPQPGGTNGDALGLAGVTLDGRYRVDALVAEGGFGYVYRGEQLLWRRPVAVKVFKRFEGTGAQAALREAFVKEGAVLNALSRKTTSIVQSYDVGEFTPPGGVPLLFTVLEWLEGRSLADALGPKPRQAWPLARALETLGPVAEALAVAHTSGVAHRDVKPRNIFLVEEVGAPAVKLLDFGAAKVAADYRAGFLGTGAGITALTVAYAAPEQLHRRHTSGPWSDVYSLALVLLELVLGRHPVEAGLIGAGGAGVLERLTGVDAAVRRVLERALAAEPPARYPDAGAFWGELAKATRPAPRRWPFGWLRR